MLIPSMLLLKLLCPDVHTWIKYHEKQKLCRLVELKIPARFSKQFSSVSVASLVFQGLRFSCNFSHLLCLGPFLGIFILNDYHFIHSVIHEKTHLQDDS